PRVRAELSRKLASHAGSREYVRVHMGEVAGRLVAVPMARGAGLISTLARADGFVVISSLREGCLKGEEVDCELLRPEHEVRNNLLITGSHDVALDLLASEIRTADPELSVASTHVGSMAGLAALRDGFCHLAGTHLLDPESADYNWTYLRRLFGEELPLLITVAHRQQGFMVAPGNPRAIHSWEDLIRPEVRFVNRQPGAGTRVLLDYQLTRLGIPRQRVRGYRQEVFTHLAVASMVETGAADVGLGILAAARARGIDFVPLAEERYDLAVRADVWESDFGEALRHALNSENFQAELKRLGGYRASETGVVQQPPGT
ncbi:MAG: substrate-binding domain-containing protein, partial [Armatimonadetes bacterium]|nr:substrate-binding domain-containing protein [Armatimonadota bacterium]